MWSNDEGSLKSLFWDNFIISIRVVLVYLAKVSELSDEFWAFLNFDRENSLPPLWIIIWEPRKVRHCVRHPLKPHVRPKKCQNWTKNMEVMTFWRNHSWMVSGNTSSFSFSRIKGCYSGSPASIGWRWRRFIYWRTLWRFPWRWSILRKWSHFKNHLLSICYAFSGGLDILSSSLDSSEGSLKSKSIAFVMHFLTCCMFLTTRLGSSGCSLSQNLWFLPPP